MPARAILDLPKMPESCSKYDEAAKSIWIEGALIESNYPYCRLIEDNLYENFLTIGISIALFVKYRSGRKKIVSLLIFG